MPVKKKTNWLRRILEFAVMFTISGSLGIVGLAYITDTVSFWP